MKKHIGLWISNLIVSSAVITSTFALIHLGVKHCTRDSIARSSCSIFTFINEQKLLSLLIVLVIASAGLFFFKVLEYWIFITKDIYKVQRLVGYSLCEQRRYMVRKIIIHYLSSFAGAFMVFIIIVRPVVSTVVISGMVAIVIESVATLWGITKILIEIDKPEEHVNSGSLRYISKSFTAGLNIMQVILTLVVIAFFATVLENKLKDTKAYQQYSNNENLHAIRLIEDKGPNNMFVHKLRKQTPEENASFLNNFRAMLIEHEQDMFTFYEPAGTVSSTLKVKVDHYYSSSEYVMKANEIQVASGRMIKDDDFTSIREPIPVLIGADLSDKLVINQMYQMMGNTYQVVGIMKAGETVFAPSDFKSTTVNKSIIAPFNPRLIRDDTLKYHEAIYNNLYVKNMDISELEFNIKKISMSSLKHEALDIKDSVTKTHQAALKIAYFWLMLALVFLIFVQFTFTSSAIMDIDKKAYRNAIYLKLGYRVRYIIYKTIIPTIIYCLVGYIVAGALITVMGIYSVTYAFLAIFVCFTIIGATVICLQIKYKKQSLINDMVAHED